MVLVTKHHDGYTLWPSGIENPHRCHWNSSRDMVGELAEAVRAFTTGAMGGEDFQQVFATSKVYCPRGDNPGFLALHNTQQPVIPMFTSLKELRRYAGKDSKYFVITGAEVIDLLPTGYGFVLDMEGEHRMVFDAKAVEEMVDFAMRRMYG